MYVCRYTRISERRLFPHIIVLQKTKAPGNQMPWPTVLLSFVINFQVGGPQPLPGFVDWRSWKFNPSFF